MNFNTIIWVSHNLILSVNCFILIQNWTVRLHRPCQATTGTNQVHDDARRDILSENPWQPNLILLILTHAQFTRISRDTGTCKYLEVGFLTINELNLEMLDRISKICYSSLVFNCILVQENKIVYHRPSVST